MSESKYKDFDELYHKEFAFIYDIAYGYIYDKSLIQDLLQEVWTAAYLAFDTIQYYSNIYGWFFITIRNQTTKLSAYPRYAPLPENVPFILDYGLLEILPPDLPSHYKFVLELYYEKGYDVETISRIYGCGKDYVYSLLHRARKRLKANLELQEDLEGGSNQ